MKILGIVKNDREFLNGWWIVLDLKTRLNCAFFRIKADAMRFKKIKEISKLNKH